MKKIIYIIIICLTFVGCNTNYIKTDSLEENTLIIEKININEKYTINSINNDVNGIVMFEELGRPDKKSNTVIGAHSGYGSNVYFNDLGKLELNDIVKVIYNNNLYEYHVTNVKVVEETDISILDDTDKNILTLLTCKIGDRTKRIVIICELYY